MKIYTFFVGEMCKSSHFGNKKVVWEPIYGVPQPLLCLKRYLFLLGEEVSDFLHRTGGTRGIDAEGKRYVSDLIVGHITLEILIEIAVVDHMNLLEGIEKIGG